MNSRALSLLVVALVATQFATARAQTADAAAINRILVKNSYRQVPIEAAGSHLSVRGSINGKPATLVVETSAPMSVIDRRSVGAYGVRVEPTDIEMDSPIGRTSENPGVAKPERFEVANFVVANDSVLVLDLTAMDRGSAQRSTGVLGLATMRMLGAVIDCGNRVLYLHPRGGSRTTSWALEAFLTSRNFVRVPMHMTKVFIPEVDCQVNGVNAKMLVETASFATILQKQLAEKAAIQLAPTGFVGEGVGGRETSLFSGTASEFAIGAFHSHDQKLSAEQGTLNVLGLDFLRAHHAVIDSGSMTLFLRP